MIKSLRYFTDSESPSGRNVFEFFLDNLHHSRQHFVNCQANFWFPCAYFSIYQRPNWLEFPRRWVSIQIDRILFLGRRYLQEHFVIVEHWPSWSVHLSRKSSRNSSEIQKKTHYVFLEGFKKASKCTSRIWPFFDTLAKLGEKIRQEYWLEKQKF